MTQGSRPSSGVAERSSDHGTQAEDRQLICQILIIIVLIVLIVIITVVIIIITVRITMIMAKVVMGLFSGV